MDKVLIGLLFILAGVTYGSFAIDSFYNRTLGWLVNNNWVKHPEPGKTSEATMLGRKGTILLYSTGLIIIGLFIIWNRNN